MAKQIYVNIPIKNSVKNREFFGKLGYSVNEQFSDEHTIAVTVSPDITIMMLEEDKFKEFTKREVPDLNKETGVILSMSADSRDQVDDIFNKAIEAGATQANETMDYGWMYLRSFRDLDGHMWEFSFIDPTQIPADPSTGV